MTLRAPLGTVDVLRPLARRSFVYGGAFTLIEMAMVMGVIGITLGAIFVAAGAVSHKTKINQASEQLNQIANGVRDYYSGRDVSFATLNGVRALNIIPTDLDFSYYTDASQSTGLAGKQVFPTDMLSGNGLRTPWANENINWSMGGDVAVSLAASDSVTAPGTPVGPVQFVVEYAAIPYDSCVDMLRANSMPGNETKLTRIRVRSGGLDTNFVPGAAPNNYLPVASGDAAAACGGGDTVTIDWYYILGNGCMVGATRC